MKFWKRDLNLAGWSGREENYSKQTAGEQRVYIYREQEDADITPAGAGGSGT